MALGTGIGAIITASRVRSKMFAAPSPQQSPRNPHPHKKGGLEALGVEGALGPQTAPPQGVSGQNPHRTPAIRGSRILGVGVP